MSTPLTWNEAAREKTAHLYLSMEDKHVNVASIRYVFERLSAKYFYDVSPETKNPVHELWTEIGVKALTWGQKKNIVIDQKNLLATLISKQRDYGHQNIAKYGREGLIIRVHDKIARLENLTKNEVMRDAQNEPISDTILDIAGYSVIGMMWESEIFLLPLM